MSDVNTECIAVIGMSGRFPGAADVETFWRNLRDGVESVSFFSEEELARAGVDPDLQREPRFVGAGGVLDDIDKFDAAFFGFNAREAEVMDPQHRLFLECAWEAFENAGYAPGAGDIVGVYAGTGISTYFFNLYQHDDLMALLGGHQIMIGNDKDHLTTHVSYKFDLRGPSVTVQTACSTSLVAVSIACQSLLDYECDMALAGGVSIAVPQGCGYLHTEGGIASPDGHCRAFDAAARGTVAGNGGGVVLLKRLADALRDRDPIRAIVRGTAVNNDGANKVGYTAPSIDGQAAVVASAQAMAGVEPASISLIEAHGTGTPLGDPIEVAALAQVFRNSGPSHRCALGSVKASIGHLDTAAGIAGFIKTVLALEHRTIPASLHFTEPNPKLELDRTPFYVPSRAAPWEVGGAPRRAGVSSFGIGGTNAHVVLEEAPDRAASGQARPFHLMAVSAPTATGLAATASRHAEHLESHPGIEIADVAYTLLVGRKAFRHRRIALCADAPDAVELLRAHPRGRVHDGARAAGRRPVVFLCSGQGSQYAGMAAGLYRHESVFREHLDRCLAALGQHPGDEIRALLHSASADPATADARLEQTALTQPTIFAVEYSLAQLWMHWGVRPASMLGHSIGEYVAACLAGVFTLDDALALVALRGRLMQAMPPGAMLAVSMPEASLRQLIDGALSLAAINMADQCVISGPAAAINRAEALLGERGVATARLRTSHAFHSSMMDPMLEEFAEAVGRVPLTAPSIPFVSNLSGDWITAAQATDPHYWARHVRSTVRFADGLARVLEEPDAVVIEIGPGSTLTSFALRHPKRSPDTLVVDSLIGARARTDDERHLLDSLARVWAAGVAVDWRAFYRAEQRARVALPTYPFERKRYWIDPPPRRAAEAGAPRHEGRIADLTSWFYVPTWTRLEAPDLPAAEVGCHCLVFDEGDLGVAIAERLRARGHAVTRVTMRSGAAVTSADARSICPDEGADYLALLRELDAAGQAPRVVVHCWNVTRGPIAFDEAQRRGFWSLLHLANTWTELLTLPRVVVTVITDGLNRVLETDRLDVTKATLQGLARVIPQEQDRMRVRSIDLEQADAVGILDALVDECLVPVTDATVAWRGGCRWIEEYRPAPSPADPARASLLRLRGVYLITGGFGDIGLTLAETLVTHWQARLVLVSRTPLPERTAWDAWIKAHPGDAVSGRVDAVRALEALGGEVLPLTADVADPAAMAEAVARAEQHFGELNGVIHAAGATGPGGFRPLSATDRAVVEAQFQPKVRGVQTLAQVLAGRPLDFCLVASSLSTVLGGLNFGSYAAANAYLDAFVRAQAPAPGAGPWIAVNWDGWRFEAPTRRASEFYLTPAEGAEVFRRVMARPRMRQVVISTGDLGRRIRQWVHLEAPAAAPDEPTRALASVHERPEIETSYEGPRNAVEHTIADVWQAVLGLTSVGIHDNFFQLGGHSLLAIQSISRLRDLFQTDISLTALFERPTVAELAEHLDVITGNAEARIQDLERMLDYIEQLSPEAVQTLLAEQKDV
jgi:acyl transferase domain-containing protein